MADEFKSDINRLQDKLTTVEVNVAQINAKADEAAKRQVNIESEIKHLRNNSAMFNATMERVNARMDRHEAEIKEKADLSYVDHKFEKINDRVETIEKARDETVGFVKKIVIRALIFVGTVAVTYVSTKLGIADLIK